MDKMTKVEKTMSENKILDRKLDAIMKKKSDNLIEISGLIKDAKKMRVEDYGDGSEVIKGSEDRSREDSPGVNSETIEAIEDEVRKGENPTDAPVTIGEQQPRGVDEVDYVGVTELKEEEQILLQKIKESTKNLDDHKQLLETMEKKNGRDDD